MFYALWQRPRKVALLLNFTFLFWYWIIVHLTSNAISCNQLKHKEFEDGGYWANEFTWYWVWLGGFERHADFNSTKIPVQNFRKFHVPNEMVHSGCTDPTQATARLVIVLVSKMQKSGTRNNNFVKWKGTFGPTDLQRWSQIFRSDQTEMACSIWFLTKISGILGRMESAPSLSSKKNEYPGENAKTWYRKSNSWLTNFQIC